MSVIGSENPDH